MKKTFNILFGVALIALMATPMVMFAQDSTTVATGGTDSLIISALNWLEAKWPIIGTIGTILFGVSELLAAIPSIKANAVYQLISGWLGKLFGKKSA